MKRYAEYKDSGIEWIGEIPKNWNRTKLKRLLATPITDGPHETPEILDDGVPFVSAEAIKNLQINFDLKRGYISPEDHERFCKKCKPQYGDIFMIKSGATTGNIARVETHEEFSVWSPLALIRVDVDKIYNDYMFQFLQSKVFQLQVELFWSYGTQQNIGMDVLGNLHVAYPAVDEQKKIAEYLTKRISKIDTLIADKQKLIDLLKEKRQAIISEAVTKGLDKNANMKDSGIEWIGEMPEGWELIRLKYLCHIKRGASPRPIDDPVYFDDNGERYWVRISDVTSSDKYLVECEQKLSQLGIEKSVKINPNDLFVSICASVGKPCISKVKACIHDGFVLFERLNSSLIDYVYSLFETGLPYKGLGKLGTQLNLNSETIGNIFVPIHRDIQKIMKFIDSETIQIDSLVSDIQTQIEKLKEYRQSIISEAVTGKVAI